MDAEYKRLAYETALRGLDKQEELLGELCSRTGVLLAAASLAASFLGTDAFQDPSSVVLVALALVAFITSIGASVYILTPKGDLTSSQAGCRPSTKAYLPTGRSPRFTGGWRTISTDSGTATTREWPQYQYILGYIALEAGDADTAIAELQKANLEDSFVLGLLARAYEKKGDAAKATEYHNKALAAPAHSLNAAFSRQWATKYSKSNNPSGPGSDRFSFCPSGLTPV